jgi:hypothetical protein
LYSLQRGKQRFSEAMSGAVGDASVMGAPELRRAVCHRCCADVCSNPLLSLCRHGMSWYGRPSEPQQAAEFAQAATVSARSAVNVFAQCDAALRLAGSSLTIITISTTTLSVGSEC